MLNELISKKEELENKLQDLHLKKETLQQSDVALDVSIMKLEEEIKKIDGRIKLIKSQKMLDDQNNIRNVLGVAFDNHIYIASPDPGNNQMIPKTSSQLQIEFFSLLKELDQKLDRNEISEEQYDFVYNSLESLYRTYNEKLNLEKVQTNYNSQPSDTSYQEPHQYYQPEAVDNTDEVEELFRRKYDYYNRSDYEKEKIDEMIKQTFHKENVVVENIDELHGRLL